MNKTVQKKDSTKSLSCKESGCNFKTKSQSSYNRHIRLHHSSGSSSKNRKPFKCSNSSCGYRTRYSWNLKEHERIHDPDHLKSSQCFACFKYFSRQRDVARHQTTCRAFLERSNNNRADESTDEGHLSEDEGQLSENEDHLIEDEEQLISQDEEQLISQDEEQLAGQDPLGQDQDPLSQSENQLSQDEVKKKSLQSRQDQLSQDKVKKEIQESHQDHLGQDKVKKESHEDEQDLIKSEQVKAHNNNDLEYDKQEYSKVKEENVEIEMKYLMKVKRFKCPKCGHRSDSIQEAKTHLDSHSSNSDWLMCPVAECTSAGYVREDDLEKHLFEIHGIKKKVSDQEVVPPVTSNGTQVTEVGSTGRATRAKLRNLKAD